MSLENLDAGIMIHSFFLRDSLFVIVVNRLDKTFSAGISLLTTT
jgi:hypothetical protein